ncbi:endolytic transglycosylase MltG [Roseivivax sp. CAU 1753]
MWRNIASNALTFLVVAVFLFGGMLIWAQSQYDSAGPLSEPICLEVPRGTNMSRVSDNLAAQGAVSSGTLFRLGADYADKTQDLKAGSYLVPEGASMREIVDIVTRGGASTCGTEVIYRIGVNAAEVEVRELDPATGRFVEIAEFDPSVADAEVPEVYTSVRGRPDTRYRVAVAEGVTSWQVIDKLNAVDVLEGTVDVPAEGSLAPDSYEVAVGDTRASLIERMRRAQDIILSEEWANRADNVAVESPTEALILASIVEKETGVPEERPQVASVFTNRLEQGMRLQTDPTVIYGITGGEGVLGRGIRQSELRAETPYNTYVITGLPPTPIANPGRASIRAALNPDTTEYIFFVADGTGGHAFAETLAEHNENVARWRQIEAERAGQ